MTTHNTPISNTVSHSSTITPKPAQQPDWYTVGIRNANTPVPYTKPPFPIEIPITADDVPSKRFPTSRRQLEAALMIYQHTGGSAEFTGADAVRFTNIPNIGGVMAGLRRSGVIVRLKCMVVGHVKTTYYRFSPAFAGWMNTRLEKNGVVPQ